MIGVECPKCDGTGNLEDPWDPQMLESCPGPHVVLEIIDGVSPGRGGYPDASLLHRVFADPEKIMWWCHLRNETLPVEAWPELKPDEYCGAHQPEYGCGWVARPAGTWREVQG